MFARPHHHAENRADHQRTQTTPWHRRPTVRSPRWTAPQTDPPASSAVRRALVLTSHGLCHHRRVLLSLIAPARQGAVGQIAWPTVLLICGIFTFVVLMQELDTPARYRRGCGLPLCFPLIAAC